jgi:hypothetical protein
VCRCVSYPSFRGCVGPQHSGCPKMVSCLSDFHNIFFIYCVVTCIVSLELRLGRAAKFNFAFGPLLKIKDVYSKTQLTCLKFRVAHQTKQRHISANGHSVNVMFHYFICDVTRAHVTNSVTCHDHTQWHHIWCQRNAWLLVCLRYMTCVLLCRNSCHTYTRVIS